MVCALWNLLAGCEGHYCVAVLYFFSGEEISRTKWDDFGCNGVPVRGRCLSF